MAFVFLYNVLLIILYSFVMSLTTSLYLKNKHRIFLILAALMVLSILDNTIVYMTEFINSFADDYNQLFMTAPVIKTIIFLLDHFFCLWLLATISEESIKKLFVFYLGCYAYALNKKKLEPLRKKYLAWLAQLYTVFATLILLEDTFVIFNIDQYSDIIVKINNRNVSEDISSIIFCAFIIYFCLHDFPRIAQPKKALATAAPYVDSLDTFCHNYHLTQREEEVLHLLLEHKSNQEIANELFLSIGTVKTHIHNIFVKLEVKKRAEIFTIYQQFSI